MTHPLFDLQVNGFFGVDFNSDETTIAEMELACEQLIVHGIDRILATVITAPVDRMCHRIQKLADAVAESSVVAQVIAGIHVEGPFISAEPGFVGAHPVASVIPADLRICQHICAAGQGLVRLVTLAPESDPSGQVTRFLCNQEIVVAAGHTNASLEELRRSLDLGLKMFTHLGNGCPLNLPRHDNIINRVLHLAKHLKISLIADGRHVPDFVLGLYLQAIPDDNVIIVSDCISAAGVGPGMYPLGGQLIRVDEAGVAWAADGKHMAGSTGILSEMSKWLERDQGFSRERVLKWTRDNPSRLIV
ncbi:MAG: N-acetylglucosamine-6-phosphate deacetylase [Planctomycetaceae bacterium]|nr:N-acetylglucosamine-6-phosphate deacetylase [Planctomycetaceae bacterium]